MRASTQGLKTTARLTVYLLATIQFVWCYFRLTQPYVNTARYELGRERMPFQGRILMMWPLRWASHSHAVACLANGLGSHSIFWFPKPVAPEVLAQALIDVSCLLLAGWLTTKLYRASSERQVLAPTIYPLFLVVCGATYLMHTSQNFRYVYDFPSLAFFAAAMVLLYLQKPWGWFAALFCIATINRETTLLLLPLYMLNVAIEGERIHWKRVLRARTLAVVLPLAGLWLAWETFIHHIFAHHRSEFYLRYDWNLKSLAAPLAWPQLFSACGYLLLFVVVMRRSIPDPRLRAWLWLIPVWLAFMFVYGILIETRIFGELIPLVVCSTAVICEEMLLARPKRQQRSPSMAVVEAGDVQKVA